MNNIISPNITNRIPMINSLLNALICCSSIMYATTFIIPSTINTTANNITAVDNAIPGFAIKNIATNNNNIDIIIDSFSYFFKNSKIIYFISFLFCYIYSKSMT